MPVDFYETGQSCGRGKHDYSIDKGGYVKCSRCNSTKTKPADQLAAHRQAFDIVDHYYEQIKVLGKTPAEIEAASEAVAKRHGVDTTKRFWGLPEGHHWSREVLGELTGKRVHE